MKSPITLMIVMAVALAICAGTSASAHRSPPLTTKQYAYTLAVQYHWTGAEWKALNEIVTPESGWNPCSVYPSRHDCGYAGSNSCGVPQASPCPSSWRGRLWTTRYAQVRWLFDYIKSRYGTPSKALAFRNSHHPHWY